LPPDRRAAAGLPLALLHAALGPRFDICGQTANPCGPGEASFLFISDLTNRAYGAELVVLIVLYVGTQLLSTLLMSTVTDRTQRMIFIALPFFFVLFIWQFPAGLLVYWITTNLWTIVQQAIVRKRLGPLRPPGQEPGPSLGDLLKRGTATAAADDSSGRERQKDRELVGAGQNKPKARPSGPPPPSPRKKKKRSGRRR
jgi:YidC/Oxa1 family membrane protein insertase